jgi:hypothetical protein
VFLAIFDQFISPEDVMNTIGIYVGSNLKWEKNPAPYAPLRLLERDSDELLTYARQLPPYLGMLWGGRAE